jgi:hypothetical protein
LTEQGEVAGVEHHAEKADREELAMPLRERQAVEPRREFSRFLLRVCHSILPDLTGLAPVVGRDGDMADGMSTSGAGA